MAELNSLLYWICIYNQNFWLCVVGYKSMDWIKLFNLKCEELKSPIRLVRIAWTNRFLFDCDLWNG